MLSTNRSVWKFIFLSIITLGIYGLVVMYKISNEINLIASPRDGKKTMNYIVLLGIIVGADIFVALLFVNSVGEETLSSLLVLINWVGTCIWYHKFFARLGEEIKSRGLSYEIGAGTFWGWYVLGSLILVGPIVAYHKMFSAMNLLAEDYNIEL